MWTDVPLAFGSRGWPMGRRYSVNGQPSPVGGFHRTPTPVEPLLQAVGSALSSTASRPRGCASRGLSVLFR